LNAMKSATRKYARKQIKWIRNKLLLQCKSGGENIMVCMLDATNLQTWKTNVRDLGVQITNSKQKEKPLVKLTCI
jgi:tRNA dimethylallyltransferase